MKVIAISNKGKELVRFLPSGRTVSVGRSPSCDVVMRAKNVRPVQFLIEWLGEGEFNSQVGHWTILDLSNKTKIDRDVGEAVILMKEPITLNGFEIKIVEDDLFESEVRPGVLRRNVQRMRDTSGGVSADAQVVEIVYVKKSTDSVVNVQHLHRNFMARVSGALPTLPQIAFTWPKQMPGVAIIENAGEKKDFALFNRGANLTKKINQAGNKIEFKNDDFIAIETTDYDYYVRLVPNIKLNMVPLAWLKDKVVIVLFLLTFIVAGLGIWISSRPPAPVTEMPKPKRFATVEVREAPPAELPAEQLAQETPPMEVKEEPPPSEDAEQKIKPKAQAPQGVQMDKKMKDPKPAPATVKNEVKIKQPKVGLNNAAPPKDVNTVGLLGKLKGGIKTGEKLSADTVINKGITSDVATGEQGFVVGQPPSGELGKGRGGSSKNEGGLAAASSTLKNSTAVDAKSVGALGISNGKGNFAQGTKLGGSGEVGGASGKGIGEGSMEVAGGLDKESVRKALAENRRAIRNCYENALLTSKDLEGRVVLRWRITPAGPVETISVQSSTVKLPSFESCVMDVVKRIIFPQAPNKMATIVIYPFVFQGKK